MYDKNGIVLKIGDYVKTVERQINSSDTTNIAIISSIEPSSAVILVNNFGMPMPFTANPLSLLYLDEKDVDKNDRSSLSSVKEMFDIMVQDLRSA